MNYRFYSNFFNSEADYFMDKPELSTIEDREYDDIIYGFDSHGIYMYESVYRGNEGTILDENTLTIVEWYEKAYLMADKKALQIPDYIGYELSFAAYVLELGAIDKDVYKDALAFISEHLSYMVNKIIKAMDLCEVKYESVYGHIKNIADVCSRLLSEDRDICECSDKTYDRYRHMEPARYFIRLNEKLDNEIHIHKSSGRNNCGGRCIINIHEKKGCILYLSSDERENPCARACVRGRGYRQTYMSPDRLRYPMKRIGKRGEGRFKRISYEEAVDTIYSEWKRITQMYGPESRYAVYATGVSALIRPIKMIKRLMALDGGYLDYYNSYSSACTGIATPYTYGTTLSGNSSRYLSDSKLIILWGYNPTETIFGSEINRELYRAKKKGIKIIVIDPRYSDTAAALADEWIGLRPSTDSALMDAMAYVIIKEGLEDRSFMDKFCIGFDEEHMPEGISYGESYESYLFGVKDGIEKTPEYASEITGVDAEVIRSLAREYALAKPAALMQGWGPQRHSNGEQSARSSTLLPCLTGNVGIAGGFAGGNGNIKLKEFPYFESVDNKVKAVIPTFLWTDAIIRGEEMTAEKDMIRGDKRLKSSIKMIFNLAGNTLINQHSDINRTKKILEDTSKCEFIVCSDLFMTSSARYADILMPGTSFMEGSNITLPWYEGDYMYYNTKAIEPIFDCRFEYEWIKDLSEKLGLYDAFTKGNETVEDWLKERYEECKERVSELPSYEKFKEDGGYEYPKKNDYIAFKEQIEDFEHNRFNTPSGKIEIFSKRLYDLGKPDEIPAIPRYISAFEGPDDPLTKRYPLSLIGWHTKRRNHSIHDINKWMEIIDPPCVWINRKDAQARGIMDGDLVNVYNDRGTIRIRAKVTDRIVEGVTAIAQGAWYSPNKDGVDVRGNINTLTTSRPTPLAKGNPQHTNLCEIELYKGED